MGIGMSTNCRALHVIAVLACLLAGGCEWARNGFKVGPNYTTPPAPLAEHWIDYQSPQQHPTTQPATDPWWHAFGDPVLNSLISDAFAQNLSLRAAGERIVEARAVRGIAVGNIFPQVQELAGGYAAYKQSDQVATATPEQWFREGELGFNAAWELDFWGRFRRSIEAADASLEASIADYDNALVVLLADVASTYVQYRTFQERVFLARQNLRIQQGAYDLAADSFRLGNTTERDPQQAKQILEQTRALIPQLEAGFRQTNNALCVLLGIPVQDLSPRLGETGVVPVVDPALALGIPADLLRRRPDVRRAEREAAAQSAGIGIAKADFYPRLSLAGSIGVRSEDINDLFRTPGSISAFGGPAFQWNILNYGRIENAVRAQESRFRQSVIGYQDAVLRANREAEDAIVRYFKAHERARYLAQSVTAARRTVEITYDQYRQGAVDFTPVFIFEAALTSQEDDLAQSQGDIALGLVDLYRSMGGGWEASREGGTFDAPPAAAPTTQRQPVLLPPMAAPATAP